MKALIVGLLLTSFCSVSQAVVITFDDRSLWQVAAGSTTLEDLNSQVVSTSFLNTVLDVGDFTLFRSGTCCEAEIAAGGAGFNIDGTTFGRVDTSSSIGDLIFTFDSTLTAFGLDVDAWNDTMIRTTVLLDGTTDVPVTTQTDQGSRFFGFTSDASFTTITFVGGVGDSWGFDNIEYSSDGPTIPEPATLTLFVLGLAGLGLARRKKS